MRRCLSILLLNFCLFSIFAQSHNPFDVYRNSDSSNLIILVQDTVKDITKIEGENPFDISHLPIRKNQYKEIEQLAVSDNTNKETISISFKPLWSLILSLCILAYIIFLKKDHLVSLVKSMFNENYLRLMSYESNAGKNLPYVLGYALFISNFVLFIWLLLSRIYDFSANYLYFKLLIAGIIFFIGKHVLLYFLAWVIRVEKERQVYNFKLISDYNGLGIIFLILNILVIFGPAVWIKALGLTGFIVFVLFLIQRYYRGVRIAKYHFNRNFFHFFIYFCAFEFSPWVIVYKLVKDLF